MKIFPAVDLKDGRVVRLTEGDYDKITQYDIEPVEAAEAFANAGAKYLHVVDLDGAKAGELSNYDIVRMIIASTDMYVEIGGGIRDEARIVRYLEAGAGRVILGTVAAKDPLFVKDMASKYGERIAVGVDARDGMVAVDGWTNVTDIDSLEFCRELVGAGVHAVIYTDISRDGNMAGTNHQVYSQLMKIDGLEITASGGISTIDDILRLKQAGVPAAIVGKALYSGALDIRDVLEAAKQDEREDA